MVTSRCEASWRLELPVLQVGCFNCYLGLADVVYQLQYTKSRQRQRERMTYVHLENLTCGHYSIHNYI